MTKRKEDYKHIETYQGWEIELHLRSGIFYANAPKDEEANPRKSDTLEGIRKRIDQYGLDAEVKAVKVEPLNFPVVVVAVYRYHDDRQAILFEDEYVGAHGITGSAKFKENFPTSQEKNRRFKRDNYLCYGFLQDKTGRERAKQMKEAYEAMIAAGEAWEKARSEATKMDIELGYGNNGKVSAFEAAKKLVGIMKRKK